MIPRNYVEAWRGEVPWLSLDMVEQDLILSKAITDIYNKMYNSKEDILGPRALHSLPCPHCWFMWT